MTNTNNLLESKQMNHVNLIGKVSSTPKIMELSNGKKIAKFTVATKEETTTNRVLWRNCTLRK